MARWIIWSQVVIALMMLVATLVDQGRAPHFLFPPGPILLLGLLSIPVLPVVVLVSGRRRKPGSGQVAEAVASIGLALVTVFASFPMVQ